MKWLLAILLAALWSICAVAGFPPLLQGQGFGAYTSSLSLQITTSSLPNATAGGDYFYPLAASGGTPPYSWSFDYTATGNISSISNGTNPTVVTISNAVGSNPFAGLTQAYINGGTTGAANAYGSSIINIASTAGSSGAYTITSTFNGTNFGTASGGTLQGGAANGVTDWWLTKDGTLFASTPTAESSKSVAITVTDSASNTANATLIYTVNSTLTVMGINHAVASQTLPVAMAGDIYGSGSLGYTAVAYGGTGTGYTWTASGLPSGLSIGSSTGTIVGTPTTPGTYTGITLTATDSGSNSAHATFNMTVAANANVSRPSYNSTTSNGFFVANGQLYDPNGAPFTPRGTDMAHVESTSQATLQRTGQSAMRIALTIPMYIAESSQASYVSGSVIPAGEFPIVGRFFDTAGNQTSGSSVVGNTSSGAYAGLGEIVSLWVSNYSLWSGMIESTAINIANEWGPGSSQTWQYAYQYTSCTISAMTATQITCSDAGASNPLANSAALQIAYISGAGGVSNQQVPITGTGGSSGAWTVAGTFHTGYTSGGHLLGGAIGVLRGVGYTNPFVVDTGSSGQDIGNLQNYSAAVFNSDPLKNIIFAFHFYNLQQIYPPGSTLAEFNTIVSELVSTRNSVGAVYVIDEFGPSAPPLIGTGGGGGTVVTAGEVIQTCEANSIPWLYWALDDNNLSGSQTSQNFYGTTSVSGTYNSPSDLNQTGLDVLENPVYGTKALATLAPYLL